MRRASGAHGEVDLINTTDLYVEKLAKTIKENILEHDPEKKKKWTTEVLKLSKDIDSLQHLAGIYKGVLDECIDRRQNVDEDVNLADVKQKIEVAMKASLVANANYVNRAHEILEGKKKRSLDDDDVEEVETEKVEADFTCPITAKIMDPAFKK